MKISQIIKTVIIIMSPVVAYAQECPSDDMEAQGIFMEYNSKATLLHADHPESTDLVLAYITTVNAAQSKVSAAFIRKNPNLACQIIAKLKSDAEVLEKRICGGSLCAH